MRTWPAKTVAKKKMPSLSLRSENRSGISTKLFTTYIILRERESDKTILRHLVQVERSIVGCWCLGEKRHSLFKHTLTFSSGKDGWYPGPRLVFEEWRFFVMSTLMHKHEQVQAYAPARYEEKVTIIQALSLVKKFQNIPLKMLVPLYVLCIWIRVKSPIYPCWCSVISCRHCTCHINYGDAVNYFAAHQMLAFSPRVKLSSLPQRLMMTANKIGHCTDQLEINLTSN